MFGGAYYIWIMLFFFVGCGGVLLLLAAIFLVGHYLEKKSTGATHKFLELPDELRERADENDSRQGDS